jgi:hypothetical protein
VTLGPIVLLCLVLLAVAVLMPGKKKVASGEMRAASFLEPAPVVQERFSIRQQQSDEAAAAIADAFKKADDAAWLQEQIERASAYFSPKKIT